MAVVKTIYLENMNEEEKKESYLEGKILEKLDHPNIIKLYETWETDRICFLVTEVCEGGELFYHIT